MDDTQIGMTEKTPYLVLARKYRPKDFSDLMVGQEPMVKTLTNAFETGRIAQAYMLTGVRGVGKTTTARILARALNYKSDRLDKPTIDLKILGEHCQAIIDGRHVDVVEMDAASHTGIDDIRDIIEQVRYKPVSARYKVFIIDEVHMLSAQAFNGLLKTLEEPPEHVKFIFATTEIRKVPITVLSRCQRFDLRRISAADLVGLFTTIAQKEGISADAGALALIARAADGSARDGLSLLDQSIAHGNGRVEVEAVRSMLGLADRSRIVDLFEHLLKGDIRAALGEFTNQYDIGANPVGILNDLADFTHLVTRLKYVPEAVGDASLSEVERLRGGDFANTVATSTLSRFWQMLLKGIPEVENAARPQGAAEMVLIRLAHAANLPSPEEAIRRLQDMGAETLTAPSNSQPSPPEGGSPQASVVPRSGSMQISPSNAPVASLKMVSDNRMPDFAVTDSEPKALLEETPKPVSLVGIKSLGDITDLCTQHRDPKLKALIRTYVRLVKLEPGRLEISLATDAPRSMVGELQQRLEKWTGSRWMVILSRETGAPTLLETESRQRTDLEADARADPDVAAILARFPGAKIMDVRVKASSDDSALPTDEVYILPVDDMSDDSA